MPKTIGETLKLPKLCLAPRLRKVRRKGQKRIRPLVAFTVEPNTVKLIDTYAREQDISRGLAVDELVALAWALLEAQKEESPGEPSGGKPEG